MHPLQDLFATSEGERGFDDRLHALFEAGDFAAAEALLVAELATMDGDIADLCRELPREAAVLAGWEHLVEAIELQEGDPITGITLAFGNDPDLVLDKGRLHEPLVTIALYTDEAHPFSSAKPAALLAESRASEGPAWEGYEEDVELYLEAGGFGPLNTALLLHPERHIFRDTDLTPAPMPYVEYVFGCWWRALRFQQAVAAEHARLEALGGIPVVAGTVEMRPELASVHLSKARAAPARRAGTDSTAEMRPELASLRISGRSATPAPRRTGALDMTVEMRPLLAGVDLTGPSEAPAASAIEAVGLTPAIEAVPANADMPEAFEVAAEPGTDALNPTVEVEPVAAEVEPEPASTVEAEPPEVPAEPRAETPDLTAEITSADPLEVPELPAAPETEALELTPELEPVSDSLDPPQAPETADEPAALELTVEAEAVSPALETADAPEAPFAQALDTAVEIEPEVADLDTPELADVPAASGADEADIAELAPVDLAPRKPREEKDPTGTGLRRRLAEAEPSEAPEKRSFLRRLFGRAHSYDEAA